MKIKLFLFVLLALSARILSASDTILVMNYNLLFYGYYTSFCTEENNNVDEKAQNLHTIIDYFKPDLFTVNELGRNASTADHLLNNALNVGGIDFYERAAYTNVANSSIVNMLYYNKNKFGIVSQAIPNSTLRDINLYKLYYKAEDLAQTQDTTYIICIVAHLKAGSSASDQQTRTQMVSSVMEYIDFFGYEGNVMFMGDFNMNSSFETAYQVMTNYNNNPELSFNDPIDMPGQWYNNSDMALHHTQSTRAGSQECFVGGGLDDRYDFILVSNDLLSGDSGFKYIDDTYLAVGQDGLRYNQSLIDPPNYSQPEEIINAMYNFSDHLPVILKLEITENLTSSNCNKIVTNNYISFNNPVKDYLEIFYNFDLSNKAKGKILDIWGNEIKTVYLKFTPVIKVSDLTPGIYFLVFEDNDKKSVHKFIKL